MDEEKKLATHKVAEATKELNQALFNAARLGLKVEISVTEFADTYGMGSVISTDIFARLSVEG